MKRDHETPGALSDWLVTATKKLAMDSAARVREEITGHFESARDDALASGADADEASRRALESLGDARTVNRRYRKVLLTESEARMLTKLVVSEMRTRNALLLFTAFAAFFLAINIYQNDIREVLVWTGVMIVQLCYLPREKSPMRARALRYFRLAVTAALPFAMSDWGMFIVVAVLLTAVTLPIELRRATLRRKLPADQWPTLLFG